MSLTMSNYFNEDEVGAIKEEFKFTNDEGYTVTTIRTNNKDMYVEILED